MVVLFDGMRSPRSASEGVAVSKVSHRSEYSIAAVSKLTGVSCHALRVWERRYGYPVPRRAPSGHRRYGDEQVRVLRQIAQLMHHGSPIGDLIAEVRAGRGEAVHPAAVRPLYVRRPDAILAKEAQRTQRIQREAKAER